MRSCIREEDKHAGIPARRRGRILSHNHLTERWTVDRAIATSQQKEQIRSYLRCQFWFR